MVHDRCSKRAWVLIVAAGIALALSGHVEANAVGHHAGAAQAATPAQQAPKNDRNPNPTATIHSSAERIARALESANRYNEAPDQQKSAQDTLKAAQGAAGWAEGLFWVGFVETAVTAVGVILVYHTLNEAKKSAETAVGALSHARISTERELRAYISVVPVGVKTLVGRESTIGQVDVRNVGKLPAHRVFVTVDMEMWEDRERAIFGIPNDEPVDRTVQPGANLIQGSKNYIDHSEIVTKPKKYIFVWGIVWYDDGFEKRRFTRFCHRYNVASRSPDGKWQSASIQVLSPDKARYHTHGNDAD